MPYWQSPPPAALAWRPPKNHASRASASACARPLRAGTRIAYYRVERRHGSFRRSVQLPSAVDPDKIQARYHDGILTITMPKDQRSMPRRIEVQK